MFRSGSFGKAGTSASHSAQQAVRGKVPIIGTKRPNPFADTLDGNVAIPRLNPPNVAFKGLVERNQLGQVKHLVEDRIEDPFTGLKIATDFKMFKYLLTETLKTRTFQQVLNDASINGEMLFKATVADFKLADAAAVLNARPSVNPLSGLSDEMSESSMKFVFRKYFEKNADDIPKARELLGNPYVDKVFLIETALQSNRKNLVREIIKDKKIIKDVIDFPGKWETKRLLLENFYASIGDRTAATKQLLEIPSMHAQRLLSAAKYSGEEDLTKRLLSDQGLDENDLDLAMKNALSYAVKEKSSPAVKRLLEMGIPVTGRRHAPLLNAASIGDLDILRLILEKYKAMNVAKNSEVKGVFTRARKNAVANGQKESAKEIEIVQKEMFPSNKR